MEHQLIDHWQCNSIPSRRIATAVRSALAVMCATAQRGAQRVTASVFAVESRRRVRKAIGPADILSAGPFHPCRLTTDGLASSRRRPQAAAARTPREACPRRDARTHRQSVADERERVVVFRPRELRGAEDAREQCPRPTSTCTSLISCTNLGSVSSRSSGRKPVVERARLRQVPRRARSNRRTDSAGSAFTRPAIQPDAPSPRSRQSCHRAPRTR
jgi:hypothetical protein